MLRGAWRSPDTFAWSGLWIAGIGFFVTRFTVTLAAYESRTPFLLNGLVPLVVGLALATFGVALVVGSFDPALVRTVAAWCTAGTLAMAGLVALILSGSGASALGPASSVGAVAILSNFLIGGAALGTITGLYAGRNRRIRQRLGQQAHQLVTINRILRHEVLNAVSIIRGRSELVGDGPPDPETTEHIRTEADRIVDAVDEVKHLARTAHHAREELFPVALAEAVEENVALARRRHPDVAFTVDDSEATDVAVWADDRLRHALYPLIDNAARYNDSADPTVSIEVVAGRDHACVRIVDNGPGLPADHRATLERGIIPDYDDPGAGFGTNVTRMYVEGFGGDVVTSVTDDGTAIEVDFHLATGARPAWNDARSLDAVGVERSNLVVVAGASLVAAIAMGSFMQEAAGVMPVIGALYGVADPVVGWITHAFHSVVFGLVYVGLLRLLPSASSGRLAGRLVTGLGWGVALWLVAASVVMPLWLNLVGVNAPVPNVSETSLLAHLLWGGVLALTYHVGADRWWSDVGSVRAVAEAD